LRVVLDATVWIASFLKPSSGARSITDAWRRGEFVALFCGELLNDIGDSLIVDWDQPQADVEEYLFTIVSGALFIPIHYQTMGLRDVNDNMLLETAIYGSADYLVTYDPDLHVLTPHVADYVARHRLTILRDTRLQNNPDEVDFCTVLRSRQRTTP
jgi:putative PIN family toxin of toxin-antitoxin system